MYEEYRKAIEEEKDARCNYYNAYKEFKPVYDNMKEEERIKIYDILIKIKEEIRPDDSVRLGSIKEEERKEAEDRKQRFIQRLVNTGLSRDKAEKIYMKELTAIAQRKAYYNVVQKLLKIGDKKEMEKWHEYNRQYNLENYLKDIGLLKR